MNKNEISIRQIFILFIVMTIPMITRILPGLLSMYSKYASVISAILSIIPLIALIYLLNMIFKKDKYHSLIEFYEDAFGKKISKIIIIVYLIWLFSLVSITIINFNNNYLNVIFPTVPVEAIITPFLVIIMLILRRNIEFFFRTVEVIFFIIIFFVIILLVIRLPQLNLYNIYPVTHLDTGLIFKGIYPIISITSYLTYLFFLGNKISNKKNLLKEGKKTSIIITLIIIATVLGTIGVFGYKVTEMFAFEYFKPLKSSNLLSTIQGLEDIIVSGFILTDFVVLTAIFYIILKLLKYVFNLKDERISITPVVFCVFAVLIILTKNKFKFEEYISIISINMNIFLCIVIPIIGIIFGKIKKKI